MNKKIKNVITQLENLDWSNIDDVSIETQEVLDVIKDNPKIIKFFFETALEDKQLIPLVEHYDFFDKIVLYVDSKDRFRLRMHVFLEDNSNVYRPHCHRWAYSSLILNGYYDHFIYGTDKQINETSNIFNLKPIFKQTETKGSIYTLDHSAFHSIKAEPGTLSFMIRGPAVKDRFLILDKKVGKKWWEYGRESETIEEVGKKSVSKDYLEKLTKKIYNMKLF